MLALIPINQNTYHQSKHYRFMGCVSSHVPIVSGLSSDCLFPEHLFLIELFMYLTNRIVLITGVRRTFRFQP